MECHKGFWNFGTAPVSRSVSVDPCHSSKCMVAWYLCCRNSLDGEAIVAKRRVPQFSPLLFLCCTLLIIFYMPWHDAGKGTCRRGQVQRRGMRHGRQRQSGREAVRGLDMFYMFFWSRAPYEGSLGRGWGSSTGQSRRLMGMAGSCIRSIKCAASSARTSGARRSSPRACFRWMRPGPWCSDSTT